MTTENHCWKKTQNNQIQEVPHTRLAVTSHSVPSGSQKIAGSLVHTNSTNREALE